MDYNEIEKKISERIAGNYDESEESYPFMDYRIFADSKLFNGVLNRGELTDVLFFLYSKNAETGVGRLSVFASSPDDTEQDFIPFDSLTDDEARSLAERFFKQVEGRDGK